jgi:hypothetical protein
MSTFGRRIGRVEIAKGVDLLPDVLCFRSAWPAQAA